MVELTPQLSLVVGSPRLIPVKAALHDPVSVETETVAGAIFIGANVSETVISCVAETVLPFTSVTCQITAVVPKENVYEALEVIPKEFTGKPTEQLSVAEAVPIEMVQSIEKISGGIFKIGFS